MPILKPVLVAGAGAGRLHRGMAPRAGRGARHAARGPAGPPADPCAPTFHPPTLDMLDELGMTALLVEQGLVCRRYQYRDRRTGEIAEFDLDVLRGDTRHPYRLQAEQWKYSRLAWDVLRERHAERGHMPLRPRGQGRAPDRRRCRSAGVGSGQEHLIEGSFLGCSWRRQRRAQGRRHHLRRLHLAREVPRRLDRVPARDEVRAALAGELHLRPRGVACVA